MIALVSTALCIAPPQNGKAVKTPAVAKPSPTDVHPEGWIVNLDVPKIWVKDEVAVRRMLGPAPERIKRETIKGKGDVHDGSIVSLQYGQVGLFLSVTIHLFAPLGAVRTISSLKVLMPSGMTAEKVLPALGLKMIGASPGRSCRPAGTPKHEASMCLLDLETENQKKVLPSHDRDVRLWQTKVPGTVARFTPQAWQDTSGAEPDDRYLGLYADH